ncbi:MAG: cell division protein FtsL [Oscillospiraceae bacterium]|jgi:cell division protein FtsL|nr:cell division protein FtsL [Oscillospiraceae bacterium]
MLGISEKNLAYDLSLFEAKPKGQKYRDNIVSLTKNEEKKQKAKLRPATLILGVCSLAVSVSILGITVYNQVQLSELTNKIYVAKKSLNESRNEYSQLKIELESQFSRENIEKYSIENLGMRKVDNTQIEYISLSKTDKAEIENSERKNILTAILEFFSKIRH